MIQMLVKKKWIWKISPPWDKNRLVILDKCSGRNSRVLWEDETTPQMLLLKFNPYISFGENQFSRCLVLKIQKSCFPLCPPGGGEKKHESKLLKLLVYCRKLTVHGQKENIKSVGISPLCFVLHVVEFYVKVQPWVQIASVWQEGKAMSTPEYCPLQQANPFRC